MTEYKKLIAGLGCRDGLAVSPEKRTVCGKPFDELALYYNNNGADELLVWDLSESDSDHERTIAVIKETARQIDIPILTGGRVRRLEDVKKYLYAGAKAVFLDASSADNIDLIKEASNRFGSEKIYVWLPSSTLLGRAAEFFQLGASRIILSAGDGDEGVRDLEAAGCRKDSCLVFCPEGTDACPEDGESPDGGDERAEAGAAASAAAFLGKLQNPYCGGVILPVPETGCQDYTGWKEVLKQGGIAVNTLETAIPWSDFKTNSDGLIPVIVQDYKTDQVLMLAYMNEQAYADTLRTGRMHYYSRSRKSQWMKGETSGHLQYVKSLRLDCDNDTILARVHQIGAACHTGSYSCFFRALAEKEHKETNPLKVFEDVFAVIQDRKAHPKEGSYTNYLFDKGIDKILKKVGEEATEIVIAAKNPDPEEIKYEISDFLYHVMVLMAEKGVTWEEITRELANR